MPSICLLSVISLTHSLVLESVLQMAAGEAGQGEIKNCMSRNIQRCATNQTFLIENANRGRTSRSLKCTVGAAGKYCQVPFVKNSRISASPV